MRKWEVEENKALPSNLVREQDFILRIRRLHRLSSPHKIVNVLLTHIDAAHGGRGPLEEAQERLQECARTTAGAYVEMSNGDVFLLWPEEAAPDNLQSQVLAATLPDGATPEDANSYVMGFRLPDGYAALRERLQHYVEISREATATSVENTPAQLLQSEAARGPLTTWSADQIGKLIQDIDLQRYMKKQAVYERRGDGSWRSLFEEWFVGFDELRRAHFPKMNFEPSEHLFLKLCQELDQRLLSDLANYPDTIAAQNLSLNLTIPSILGSAFASFVRALPRTSHNNIVCELNCGDLFQDFTTTLNAMDVLRQEGFRTAIDSVTPDMLMYMNLAHFKADYIKINVSKERYEPLDHPKTRLALMALPREKLVFFRCDHEQALVLGQSLGVTKFQGWYIDDVAQQLRE